MRLHLKCFRILACAILLVSVLGLQATEPDHQLRVEWDSTNTLFRLTWPSVNGRTYFVQHSGDLIEQPWNWLPQIESGNGTTKEWAFVPTEGSDRGFWRLASSDIPTADPANDDFDGDGVSNMDELLQGTNPLVNLDTDHDGLPDDWEMKHYTGLTSDGSGDLDQDGYTDAEEFAANSSPLSATAIPDTTSYAVISLMDISFFEYAEYSGAIDIRKLTNSGKVLFNGYDMLSPFYNVEWITGPTSYVWSGGESLMLEPPSSFTYPLYRSVLLATDINEEGKISGEYAIPWEEDPGRPTGSQPYYQSGNRLWRALSWDVNTAVPTELARKTFSASYTYAFRDSNNNLSAQVDDTTEGESFGKTIADNGMVYGVGVADYAEVAKSNPLVSGEEDRKHAYDGFSWTGTAAPVQLGDRTITEGTEKYVYMARGGVTTGLKSGASYFMPQVNGIDVNMSFYDLNASGKLLGEMLTSQGYRTGEIKLYDATSQVYSDTGLPVGVIPFALNSRMDYLSGDYGDFLWSKNPRSPAMYSCTDLNKKLATVGWSLIETKKINDSGMIAAVATNNVDNSQHMVLLVPFAFLDGKNKTIDPSKEALAISNYWTGPITDSSGNAPPVWWGPEKVADTSFNTESLDEKNFRIQVASLDANAATINVKLEVLENEQAINTFNYGLNNPVSGIFRSPFIRLVADAEDDASSNYSNFALQDPHNQTIKVKLGQKLRASYLVGTSLLRQEIMVGRPKEENYNGSNWKRRDIRELKVHVTVFRKYGTTGTPAVSRARAMQDVETLGERYAQAGIKIILTGINMGETIPDPSQGFINGEPVAGYIQDPGIELPSAEGVDWSTGFTPNGPGVGNPTPSKEEQATIVQFKDQDPDSIDVMIFEKFHPQLEEDGVMGVCYAAQCLQTIWEYPVEYANTVALAGNIYGPYVLPHECMHIAFDTSLHGPSPVGLHYDSGTSATRGPEGNFARPYTKLMGPYPANMGSPNESGTVVDHITKLRECAETLPKP